MEMQYTGDTDFVSTSCDFLEGVMNVLDTEQTKYQLVCNTDKTQGVHMSREEQDWQKNTLDIVEAHCYFVDHGRTDREQIRSRINNNDCRTFRPRRPLSTAYRTV